MKTLAGTRCVHYCNLVLVGPIFGVIERAYFGPDLYGRDTVVRGALIINIGRRRPRLAEVPRA